MGHNETAVFGGGCFWCLEAIYKRVRGVEKIEPGYAGGHSDNPSYKMVCTGTTGHAEVIRVTYDPVVIAYPDLLEIFWHAHDPTTLNRQGNDIGMQYRSIILYQDKKQKEIAELSLKRAGASGMFVNPIVTKIEALKIFFPAEDYHSNYFENNPNQPYCRAIIAPKVQYFLDGYYKN
ncbi:MAG: peptide-methionine (S)-S-oxide reductase MsrA [Anaerolineaceae bacterium]|nr:peptide-methionine (S)-S-oxide reductase MsrA [Anaerolineaceae bacterium]